MLHKESVTSDTLELIKKLQTDPLLAKFILVGGTGLSLQIGHRKSIDIDLFTTSEFDVHQLLQHVEYTYQFSMQFMHGKTLKGIINHVFVDFIYHPYPIIRPSKAIDGISIISKEDIAAMKLNAITTNGTRVKDFIDIYFLLKEFTLNEILNFYAEKYNHQNTFHALKSLTYFQDLDTHPWPNMILEKHLTPEELKSNIIAHSQAYLNQL